MTDQRLSHLVELLDSLNVDAIALNPGPTITYLTGLHFHLMERPTVLLLVPGKVPVLVLPELEAGKLVSSRIELQASPYADDPATWPDAFAKAIASLSLTGGRIAVEPNQIRFLEMDFLQKAAPNAGIVSGGTALAMLRVQKDAGEIKAMRRAVQVAQAALNHTLSTFKMGMTEKEIAAELMIQLYRAGSDAELPFLPIVASGPNSANPHAVPGDRRVQAGDFLVIDYGASADGYFSDLTRTFVVGEASPGQRKIYEAVKKANEAGRLAGSPGLEAGKVDAAARAVITRAGYGPQFIHRTGHGLGMESHEEPYIFSGNTLKLQVGMAYTVEPGIYVQGFGGVRIEDNMVITPTGSESLSDFSRELTIIGVS